MTNRFGQLSWRQLCWLWESWQWPCTSCLPSLLVSSSQSQEQAVQDLVQRIAQMEERMNTAGRAIRGATLRAQAAGNSASSAETATTAAGAAGKRQRTVTTALVDTRLLGKPRTFSGLHADWRSRRFTFTAHAGGLRPDKKRHSERAVAAGTDGEIFNVQLSVADRAMSTQLLQVVVMCSESGALKTLE